MAGLYFCSPSSLYFFLFSSSFSFYIHPRYTHTSLYFIRPSMLRKYLKNESIGRWLLDISITIHTCPNWINRSTLIVRSESHFSLSILIVEKFSYLLPSCILSLQLFFLLHCPSAATGLKQIRYPLSINPCYKQTTRSYQPPGLIKSNFCYWPTVQCL